MKFVRDDFPQALFHFDVCYRVCMRSVGFVFRIGSSQRGYIHTGDSSTWLFTKWKNDWKREFAREIEREKKGKNG